MAAEEVGEHGCVVLTHDLDFDSILAATHGEKPGVVQIRVADVSPAVIESKSLLSNPADSGQNRTGLGRGRKLRRAATRIPTRRSRDPCRLQVRTHLYPPTLGADHKRSHAMAELLTGGLTQEADGPGLCTIRLDSKTPRSPVSRGRCW